ncbi:hypothetical protein MXAN_2909 [Myxococcus xanthus DK 1622]|uniref:Uncharacterized protein n=1 Tax=Myxococcus xanthus (strain DK1622) TaxID=246197 RepID=Q1D8A3_MYXXD|nr:hypothetical protein [Myxococcus xanthus]ABF88109.1 hypothetical protein MXAN_2909 [Myxococcus xanthus DK 1622]QVW71636.1 hypothetical protein JTM82_19770 [Myxococcus xanthus DZ2]NOJ56305.1 hypothetical protein [Myxococcus xanthus]QPM82390.1 hypothetical protein I5Q59_14415 [Myxococcus xanthus]QZZ50627.1 hypothetical protein MyxoNM_15570 [Myxococcus xanthus]
MCTLRSYLQLPRRHPVNSQDFEGTMTSAARPSGRAPGLRVIKGEGRRREEPLASRDAVARVLMEAGADLLLRRISPARAGEIERKVDRVLDLFDRVDVAPVLMPVLKRHLDELEALMRETREVRAARR